VYLWVPSACVPRTARAQSQRLLHAYMERCDAYLAVYDREGQAAL
jgi:hypothetical protein